MPSGRPGPYRGVGGYCPDVFVLEGPLEGLSASVDTRRSLDRVEVVECALLPLDGVGHARAQ